MALPPTLTPEARAAALAKAKDSRRRRAAVKEQVRKGEMTISQVLELAKSDDVIAKMRVLELLESKSGVGKIRWKNSRCSLTRKVKYLTNETIARFGSSAD